MTLVSESLSDSSIKKIADYIWQKIQPGESGVSRDMIAVEIRRAMGDASPRKDEEALAPADASPTSPANPSLAEGYYLPKDHPDHPYPREICDNKLDPYALDVALRVYEDSFPDASGITFDGAEAAIKAYLGSMKPVLNRERLKEIVVALRHSQDAVENDIDYLANAAGVKYG